MDGNLDLSQLRVIIPVGGEAKRLKPLTAEVSKALVRIFNRPLVEYSLWELASQGVKHFIFGAKGYVNYTSLFDYFGDGTGFSAQYNIYPRVHIKYQPRIEDVGSAESVRINMDYYGVTDTFLVVQGDNLFEVNLKDMLSFMERTGALMVIGLTPVEDVESYGIANIDQNGQIKTFVEKPRASEAPSRLANAGVYLISPNVRRIFDEPEVQAMVRVNKRLDFGLDFIPYLIKTGRPVHGYVMEGEWFDVGTTREYLRTMLKVLNMRNRVGFYLGASVSTSEKLWIQGSSPESIMRRETIRRMAAEKKIGIQGSVLIGRHCHIGEGSLLRDSTIDNFCILGKNVTIERSAILDRVVLEDGTSIQDSIIGRHARVRSTMEHPTWVIGLSVVGDDSVVGEGCLLTSQKVEPHTVIPDEVSLKQEVARNIAAVGSRRER